MIYLLRKIAWLLNPPRATSLAAIEKDQRCPVCGKRRGNPLRAIRLSKPPLHQIVCRLQCAECGARWFIKPVGKATAENVLPCVARNEQEDREDRNVAILYEEDASKR